MPTLLGGVQDTVNGIAEEEMDGIYQFAIHAISIGKCEM
jgi:hypothetical protein